MIRPLQVVMGGVVVAIGSGTVGVKGSELEENWSLGLSLWFIKEGRFESVTDCVHLCVEV